MFTEEERDAHREFIPWTRTLADVTTEFRGETVDLLPFVKTNKDKLVLKPNDGYGGFGVAVGPTTVEKDWLDLIDQSFNEHISYTVQELVRIPVDQFPLVEDGEFKGFAPKNVNVNLWSHDGDFAGAFVRAAEGSIINVHQGGGMLPVFFAGKR